MGLLLEAFSFKKLSSLSYNIGIISEIKAHKETGAFPKIQVKPVLQGQKEVGSL